MTRDAETGVSSSLLSFESFASFCCLVLPAPLQCRASDSASPAANLIIVLSDDHRWDALGDVKANDWRHYDEAVSHLDEQLGRLLAALRETGLDRRTVVVLLGDNGYMMGERGIGGPDSGANGKQVPYESSLRVPFLLLGPGLPKGLVSDLPVSSLDLPPTLLSLAGVPAPTSWPGRDLPAALAGKLEIREAFAEWSDEESPSFGRLAFRAVRTPTHKLIVWKDPARGDELYDLAADPAETRNLAVEPAAADIARDLRSRLLAWMKRNGDPALSWPARP
jgi:arylsulfatase A-like enzyme